MPSLLHTAHLLVVATYFVLPVAVLTGAVIARARHRRRGPLLKWYLAACGGIVISSAVCLAMAAVTGGRPIAGEALLAAYFATGLLLLTRGFDRFLWLITTWMFGLRRAGARRWLTLRSMLAGLIRAAILFGIGLPYFLAAAITYRPHLHFDGDPQSILHRSYQSIEFPATDGVRLAGWWIPANTKSSRRTVLLCHGWASTKARDLFMVRDLVEGGYNVLAFDFRGHGQSEGNLIGFGDIERRDVLGAVRWLVANHPRQSQHLMGLGINTGGAALLAAAADPSVDGQRIDAVAVYGTFDTLANEARDLAATNFPKPLAPLANRIGLPLAALQLDSDLPRFSPAHAISQIWPRPVMVLHGVDDQMVPFERGESLFEAAYPPRQYYWIEKASQDTALSDKGAAAAVKEFFDNARTVL